MRRLSCVVALLYAVVCSLPAFAHAEVFDDNPAAVSAGPGQVAVFVRGADGVLLSRSNVNGIWGAWTPIPGLEAGSGPAVVANGGNLQLYVRGVDNQMWQNVQTNGEWRGWVALGGTFMSAPAASMWSGGGPTDVIARGLDSQLYRRTFGGGAPPGQWAGIGTSATAAPGAAGTYKGRMTTNVVARSASGTLLSMYLDVDQQWSDLGGSFVGAPGAAGPGMNAIDVFVKWTDGTLWHRSTAFNAWRNVNSQPLSSSPAAAFDSSTNAWVFARVGEEIWTMQVRGAGTETPFYGTWSSLGVPTTVVPPPPPAPAPPPDADGDGVLDSADRCVSLGGPAIRSGCPKGLLADPSIRYRVVRGGIRVVAYYVKATKGARVVVTCSRGCRKTVLKGRGSTRAVRVKRLNGRRLKNGARITVSASMSNRLTTTVVDRVKRGRRVEGRPGCKPVGC